MRMHLGVLFAAALSASSGNAQQTNENTYATQTAYDAQTTTNSSQTHSQINSQAINSQTSSYASSLDIRHPLIRQLTNEQTQEFGYETNPQSLLVKPEKAPYERFDQAPYVEGISDLGDLFREKRDLKDTLEENLGNLWVEGSARFGIKRIRPERATLDSLAKSDNAKDKAVPDFPNEQDRYRERSSWSIFYSREFDF